MTTPGNGNCNLQELDLCLHQFHPFQLSMHSAELSRNHRDNKKERAIVRLSGQDLYRTILEKLSVPNYEGHTIDTNSKIFQCSTSLRPYLDKQLN